MLTSAKVVDRNSAAIPGRGDMISIPADHKHICKFGSREDEGYNLVLGALKKMVVIVPVRKKEIVSFCGVPTSKHLLIHWQSPVFNFNNAGAAINNQAGQQTINGGMNFGSFGR